jgi:hypothetical protein
VEGEDLAAAEGTAKIHFQLRQINHEWGEAFANVAHSAAPPHMLAYPSQMVARAVFAISAKAAAAGVDAPNDGLTTTDF